METVFLFPTYSQLLKRKKLALKILSLSNNVMAPKLLLEVRNGKLFLFLYKGALKDIVTKLT
jgi:hypothetical protein